MKVAQLEEHASLAVANSDINEDFHQGSVNEIDWSAKEWFGSSSTMRSAVDQEPR